MTIRRKTFVVIGLTLASLLLVLRLVSSLVLRNGFAQVEQKDAYENVARVQAALEDSLTKINNTAGDWAWWDDTYRFISDQNPGYARANLGEASIANLHLNIMVLVRSSGEIAFGTGFDLKTGKKIPLSPSVKPHLAALNPLSQNPGIKGSRQGLLMLPEGPLLVASRCILPSNKKGPSRGTLIFGRYLNQRELKELIELTRFSLSLQRLDSSLPPDFQDVAPRLSASSRTEIIPADHNELWGYVLLDDIYQKPALLLRVTLPRAVHTQENRTMQYLSFSLVAACLIVCGVMFLLLEKLVLSRLQKLEQSVRTLTHDKEISHRVPVMGDDELGTLANRINELLATIEHSQQSLLESQNRLRVFMDNNPGVVFIKDRAGYYLYINPTFEHQLHRKSGEVIGKTDADLWPPDVAQTLRAHDLEVLTTGRVLDVEESVPIPNRPPSQWLVFKFPVYDKSGQVLLGGIGVDITERKAVERLKSEFVSTVSHELRTPLTSISGSLGLLEGGVVGQIPASAQPILAVAQRNCQRLISLINDLLDMEKIESGKMDFDIRPVRLPFLLDNALAVNQAYAQNLGVKIGLEGTIPDVELNVDADRLTQVLTNLLSNACKFSPQGSLVKIKATPIEADWVRVCITNSGPPIPDSFRSQIFEKFAQADASDTRQKGGTGLGLSISKTIVEKMGGHIGFESDEGQGTTFYFDFEIVSQPILEAASPAG